MDSFLDWRARLVVLADYTREKALHIIVNILCVGSNMRFIAILDYMYAENPYTTEISLHIHNYCSYMYTMGLWDKSTSDKCP